MIKAYIDKNGITQAMIRSDSDIVTKEIYALNKALIECGVPKTTIIKYSSAGIVAGMEELEKQREQDVFADGNIPDADVLRAILKERQRKKSEDTFDQIFGDLFDE